MCRFKAQVFLYLVLTIAVLFTLLLLNYTSSTHPRRQNTQLYSDALLTNVTEASAVYSRVDLGCNMSELMLLDNFRSLVTWKKDKDGVISLSVSNCSLDLIDREFTRETISKFAPTGLSFIGDSLSRYQYLNLVYFIEHGEWYADSEKPNENEIKFDNWTDFYKITNQRLMGHEICDCYRSHDINQAVENRYFVDGYIKIAYFQLFGENNHVWIHDTGLLNMASCTESLCDQQLCTPGYCASSVLPVKKIGTVLQPGALHGLMSENSNFTHILFNAGLWWISNGENVFIRDHKQMIVDNLNEFRKENRRGKIHWKMTTACKLNNKSELEFAMSMIKSGLFHSVFDSWSLTVDVVEQFPENLRDDHHFNWPVYKGLNLALVAYLSSLNI